MTAELKNIYDENNWLKDVKDRDDNSRKHGKHA